MKQPIGLHDIVTRLALISKEFNERTVDFIAASNLLKDLIASLWDEYPPTGESQRLTLQISAISHRLFRQIASRFGCPKRLGKYRESQLDSAALAALVDVGPNQLCALSACAALGQILISLTDRFSNFAGQSNSDFLAPEVSDESQVDWPYVPLNEDDDVELETLVCRAFPNVPIHQSRNVKLLQILHDRRLLGHLLESTLPLATAASSLQHSHLKSSGVGSPSFNRLSIAVRSLVFHLSARLGLSGETAALTSYITSVALFFDITIDVERFVNFDWPNCLGHVSVVWKSLQSQSLPINSTWTGRPCSAGYSPSVVPQGNPIDNPLEGLPEFDLPTDRICIEDSPTEFPFVLIFALLAGYRPNSDDDIAAFAREGAESIRSKFVAAGVLPLSPLPMRGSEVLNFACAISECIRRRAVMGSEDECRIVVGLCRLVSHWIIRHINGGFAWELLSLVGCPIELVTKYRRTILPEVAKAVALAENHGMVLDLGNKLQPAQAEISRLSKFSAETATTAQAAWDRSTTAMKELVELREKVKALAEGPVQRHEQLVKTHMCRLDALGSEARELRGSLNTLKTIVRVEEPKSDLRTEVFPSVLTLMESINRLERYLKEDAYQNLQTAAVVRMLESKVSDLERSIDGKSKNLEMANQPASNPWTPPKRHGMHPPDDPPPLWSFAESSSTSVPFRNFPTIPPLLLQSPISSLSTPTPPPVNKDFIRHIAKLVTKQILASANSRGCSSPQDSGQRRMRQSSDPPKQINTSPPPTSTPSPPSSIASPSSVSPKTIQSIMKNSGAVPRKSPRGAQRVTFADVEWADGDVPTDEPHAQPPQPRVPPPLAASDTSVAVSPSRSEVVASSPPSKRFLLTNKRSPKGERRMRLFTTCSRGSDGVRDITVPYRQHMSRMEGSPTNKSQTEN